MLDSPWNSPGQNTGVGSLSLLQGTFPTQGSNPGLLHCRWILYQLSHKGSPRILECLAYPISSGSSQTRTHSRVSCIVGGFFTNWAIKEALHFSSVQSLSHIRLFTTLWTAAQHTSLSITNTQSFLKLMSIQSGMPSNYPILCRPLLLLPSVFPSIRSDLHSDSRPSSQWCHSAISSSVIPFSSCPQSLPAV